MRYFFRTTANAVPMGKAYAVLPICSRYLCANPNWITTRHTYDVAGQLTSTQDPRSNSVTYSYQDNYSSGSPSGATDGYLTSVTYPGGFVDSYFYDFSSGQIASHPDWNGQAAQYLYNDSGGMNRLTETMLPDKGDVKINYSDPAPPSVEVTTATGEPAGPIVGTTQYDGLGRKVQTQLNSDPDGTNFVDTVYDANGRVYSVSNPHRTSASASDGTTIYTSYDPIDRPLVVTNPDSSTKQSTYGINSGTFLLVTTSIDENGHQWKRSTNGLGQLVSVVEPASGSQSFPMETDYSYDVLGNLLEVTQWGGPTGSPGPNGPINRFFAYNGMSWLIAANNPESASAASPASLSCSGTSTGTLWTTCYAYDADGNLSAKNDNRGITTTYQYDPLNHLLAKIYSGDASQTPFACYEYGKSTDTANLQAGRLKNAWTQSASHGACYPTLSQASGYYLTARSITLYDPMGRVKNEQQCTPSNCSGSTPYTPSYSYDWAGNLTSLSSGAVVPQIAVPIMLTSAFDGSGHLQAITSSWTDSTHPTSLFASQNPLGVQCSGSTTAAYAPPGGLLNAQLGSGVTINRVYDTRLRVNCEIDSGSKNVPQTNGSATVTISGMEQPQ
jgi:YD repeat-containing protein